MERVIEIDLVKNLKKEYITNVTGFGKIRLLLLNYRFMLIVAIMEITFRQHNKSRHKEMEYDHQLFQHSTNIKLISAQVKSFC